MKSIFLVTLMTLGFCDGLAAQGGGTEQERAACTPDVKKLCAPVIQQGDLAILACLQQNRPRLSKACSQVLINNGQ
jgi:hypothetical protein